MKKYMLDLKVTENILLHTHYCLLKLTHQDPLPQMLPGQFVQVLVDNSPNTFLRRPISIHYIDSEKNELWLLVQIIGEGTRHISQLHPGDLVNILLPLGSHFSIPDKSEGGKICLLIGGGVGTAPLLYLGAGLKQAGFTPIFLLGARTAEDLVQLDEFSKIGIVYITTEDGSQGEIGYVTNHSILKNQHFDYIYTCGPKPMMQAVARHAYEQNIICEVSLENTMACGIGACLCCVEKTTSGHVCVCTEGPVFNINKLKWQN